MQSIKDNKSKKLDGPKGHKAGALRQPILIYRSTTSALTKDRAQELNASPNTHLKDDWMSFINELNIKMLKKIYF